ncbi:MAG TPA: type II toxin-antitoxin system HicA family toxin [Spirochaetota bacterium]|nr:type II toxin-antitoxin system HicA family toxin [Spirochaetota bacterium]
MKIPRDVNGEKLASALQFFGYSVSRQTGSHIRLTAQQHGEHHVTIPAHKPLKIGTLNSILNDISEHFGISKEEIITSLKI